MENLPRGAQRSEKPNKNGMAFTWLEYHLFVLLSLDAPGRRDQGADVRSGGFAESVFRMIEMLF